MSENAAIQMDPTLTKFAHLLEGESVDLGVFLHFCDEGHQDMRVFLEKRTSAQIAGTLLGAVAMNFHQEITGYSECALAANDINALRQKISADPNIMTLEEKWRNCAQLRRGRR